MIRKFFNHNDELIAIVIGANFKKDGVEFFISGQCQQLDYMCHSRPPTTTSCSNAY